MKKNPTDARHEQTDLNAKGIEQDSNAKVHDPVPQVLTATTSTECAVTAPERESLQAIAESVRAYLTAEHCGVANVRYAIGVLVNRVIHDATHYGFDAVGKIARAVDRDSDSLYDYAAVARVWPKDEFEQLLQERNAKGLPLTFSHFVELARKPRRGRSALDPVARERLRAQAVEQAWSVSRLRDAVRAELDTSSSEGASANDGTSANDNAAANERTPTGEELDRLRKTTFAWLEHVDELEQAVIVIEQRGLATDERDAAAAATEQLESLRGACDRLVARLQLVLRAMAPLLPSHQV